MGKQAKTMSIVELLKAFSTERKAVAWMEGVRWNGKPRCGHCNATGRMSKPASRPLAWWCKSCRRQFTVKTNSFMHSSNIKVQTWCIALYMVVTARKGISSLQLSKELGITQKSAWFMAQRIREAMQSHSFKLGGIVEVDECYMGGKEANKHASRKLHAGRGVAGKQPVVGMRERGGRARAMPVGSTSKETLQGFIADNVKAGSTVYTDDHRSYTGLGSRNEYRHGVVKHSVAEYVNGQAHTNGIESMWAILKRGYHGTHHHMSGKHLHRYVDEFTFRLSEADCQTDTVDRMESICKNGANRKLGYRE